MASASEPFLRCSRSLGPTHHLICQQRKTLGQVLAQGFVTFVSLLLWRFREGGIIWIIGHLRPNTLVESFERPKEVNLQVMWKTRKRQNENFQASVRPPPSCQTSVRPTSRRRIRESHQCLTVNDKLTCFALYFSNFCLFEVQVITAQHWLAFPSLQQSRKRHVRNWRIGWIYYIINLLLASFLFMSVIFCKWAKWTWRFALNKACNEKLIFSAVDENQGWKATSKKRRHIRMVSITGELLRIMHDERMCI